MTRILLSLFALATTLPCCQAQDKVPDASALLSRLYAVKQTTSLDDSALKPWYLKLEVTPKDAKGNSGKTATLEEWWAAADKVRTVYTSPDYKATVLHSSAGYFRTTGAGAPPDLFDRLLREVVHPAPFASDLDGTVPELRKQTIDKADLDCIMLDLPLKNLDKIPVGFFPTYCLGQNENLLHRTYDLGTQSVIRDTVGTFQGRRTPIGISVFNSGTLIATARIVVLQIVDEAIGRFSDVAGIRPLDMAITRVAGEVGTGKLIDKVQPEYPALAKSVHEDGSVVFDATIGTDGHIHRLRVTGTPRSYFALAAYAAVRQWVYTPFLIKGVPVVVNTAITVNFNSGPRR